VLRLPDTVLAVEPKPPPETDPVALPEPAATVWLCAVGTVVADGIKAVPDEVGNLTAPSLVLCVLVDCVATVWAAADPVAPRPSASTMYAARFMLPERGRTRTGSFAFRESA